MYDHVTVQKKYDLKHWTEDGCISSILWGQCLHMPMLSRQPVPDSSLKDNQSQEAGHPALVDSVDGFC